MKNDSNMVFIVEKPDNYTIMPNYHLRDKELSLRAKGLLSVLIALPSDWALSIRGLHEIVKESKETITATLKELIENNYVFKLDYRNKGRFQTLWFVSHLNDASEQFKLYLIKVASPVLKNRTGILDPINNLYNKELKRTTNNNIIEQKLTSEMNRENSELYNKVFEDYLKEVERKEGIEETQKVIEMLKTKWKKKERY